jgi:hypothetical protein
MMKRVLLSVLAAVAVALFVTKLHAEQKTAAPKMVTPDWHYKWHEGRWWYWMPEKKWMVWSGKSWVPYEQFAKSPKMVNVSQDENREAGTAETQSSSEGIPTGDSSGYSCPPTYSGGSSSSYAGYGWSWGPGTAFRDSPGRRF